jgi:hypothetical protein
MKKLLLIPLLLLIVSCCKNNYKKILKPENFVLITKCWLIKTLLLNVMTAWKLKLTMEEMIQLPYDGLTIEYFEKLPKKHGGKKVNRHEISGNTYTFEFGMVGVPQNKGTVTKLAD